jgi:hypothetical protein
MKQINNSLDESVLQKLKEWFHSASDDEAVRSAISCVLSKKVYSDLLQFEGNIDWEGNLDEMRAVT